MTELKLYQWIEDNNIEYHWETNNGKDDVIIFPLCCQVQSFNEMFSASIFSDSGIACIMKNGYFAFWMNDICEYYGLEIENIFPKEKVRIPN
jgi:aspartate aminotransferase-like enzyme